MSRHPSSFLFGWVPSVWSSIPRRVQDRFQKAESLNSIGPFLRWSTSIILTRWVFTSQEIVIYVLKHVPSKFQVGKDGLQHWLAPHWRVPGQEWCERLSGLSWHLWCYRQGDRETSIGLSCCCFLLGLQKLAVICWMLFFFWLAGWCMCVRSSWWLCSSWCSTLLGVHSPRFNGDRARWVYECS